MYLLLIFLSSCFFSFVCDAARGMKGGGEARAALTIYACTEKYEILRETRYTNRHGKFHDKFTGQTCAPHFYEALRPDFHGFLFPFFREINANRERVKQRYTSEFNRRVSAPLTPQTHTHYLQRSGAGLVLGVADPCPRSIVSLASATRKAWTRVGAHVGPLVRGKDNATDSWGWSRAGRTGTS